MTTTARPRVSLAPTRALLLGALLVGCGTGNSGPRPKAPIPLVATTILDLSLGDDDSVFIARLNHATRLPDGRIVALDGDAMTLVFLDSTGAFLERVGREGSGPGEFQFPSWVGRCHGDSLFVWDAQLKRMSVFAPSGHYAREFRVPLVQPFQFRCSPAGSIAAFDSPTTGGGPPVPGASYPVHRSRLVVFNAVGDSTGAVSDVPLGQERPLGSLAAMAFADSLLLLGISSSTLLTSHDLHGDQVAVESLALVARAPTDAEYEAELDRMAHGMGGSVEMRARIREMLAVAPKPDVLPLYRALLVSDDATRWLTISLVVDSVTRVLGRSPEGDEYILALPAGIELFEGGSNFLLGKISDADGNERLVMYRIRLPGH